MWSASCADQNILFLQKTQVSNLTRAWDVGEHELLAHHPRHFSEIYRLFVLLVRTPTFCVGVPGLGIWLNPRVQLLVYAEFVYVWLYVDIIQ